MIALTWKKNGKEEYQACLKVSRIIEMKTCLMSTITEAAARLYTKANQFKIREVGHKCPPFFKPTAVHVIFGCLSSSSGFKVGSYPARETLWHVE
jgi:hypothetical protein